MTGRVARLSVVTVRAGTFVLFGVFALLLMLVCASR